ncbi:arginine--tRNA ligase [Candidatus Saccharibacteria bacterium]|nr:arginine--tRNA ligase [Candidatus Saccharibacteria bacterium]
MEQIKNSLENYLKAQGIEDIALELTLAPENTGADFSTNLAMRLAKTLHKSPLEIANDIKNELENPDFEIEVATPGFLNFTMKPEFWKNTLENLAGKTFTSNDYQDQVVLTEFSDPNPFKVLHVGHLYTSIVGDSISRLFENAGGDVKRLNFGGDVGLHVAKSIYALKDKELTGDTPAEKTELIGKCYVEGTRAYDDDEIAKQEITQLNTLIYDINKSGPDKSYDDPYTAKIAYLYWWGREASYAYFAEFYRNLGLVFDKFYPESSVAELGKETVLKNTPETYQESDGAIIFKGEKFGLHTRVFINKEGLPTYEAKDVGLIFQKNTDYHFDKSVVITGDEQKEYMRVVMKSIEQYAPELIEKSVHLTHGMVKLPGAVKMSSRKGNFIKAVDVLDMIKETLKTEYNSDDEKIALGAIKYAFLKSKLGGDIELDIKESVSMTGNSGPYLQYSAVRAKKILAKANGERTSDELDTAEINLIKKMSNYESVLAEATKDLAPHKLATYLYETAQEFSRFYENCPVAGSDNETERKKIVETYLKIITHGLNLLGIEVPERM